MGIKVLLCGNIVELPLVLNSLKIRRFLIYTCILLTECGPYCVKTEQTRNISYMAGTFQISNVQANFIDSTMRAFVYE